MIRRKICLSALAFLALPVCPRAAQRNYIDTYGPETIQEGHLGVETRNDYRSPNFGNDYFTDETTGEIGVTDRDTVGATAIFVEGQGFTAARLENRYHLAKMDEWPIDTAVYVAFKDADGHKDRDAIESKLILSKDVEQVNVTGNGILNLVRKIKANGNDEWDVKPGVAVAASYKTGTIVTPGIELLIQEYQSRITPGVYVALAPNMRLSAGLGIGVEHRADNLQLKTLFQVEF